MRFWKSGLALAIGGVSLLLAYQNCAKDPGSQLDQNRQTDVEIDYPVQAMASEKQDSTQFLACEFENLHCLRKIYSPAVEDMRAEEILCLDEESAQNCLKVQSIFYNTAHALEACADCSADDAKQGGQYNREEVTCWIGTPAAGPESLFALRSSFQDAAQAVLQTCGGGQ